MRDDLLTVDHSLMREVRGKMGVAAITRDVVQAFAGVKTPTWDLTLDHSLCGDPAWGPGVIPPGLARIRCIGVGGSTLVVGDPLKKPATEEGEV